MIIKAPIKLIGNNGSPYTRKMVALLRYKHIPYKIIWGEPDEYLDRNNIGNLNQFYTQPSYSKILKRKLRQLLTQPLLLES